MTQTKHIGGIISMSAMEHFLNKKYRSISEIEKDLGFLMNYFVESNYIITRIDKYFYIAKNKMIPTKYAIRCSTEEQAIECNIKKLKSGISPDIINFYRNKGYTIITHEEAKELGLLGEVSKKETTEPRSENILTYEQGIERGRQIGYKEGRRDRSKEITDEKIDKIISDIGESPFAMTWETEARNMRKILKKHLQSLQKPTKEIKYEGNYKKSMGIVD